MDKISESKREVRLIEWRKMYAEYQASGKTVQAWYSENDVNIKTFYYRLRKVREALLEQTEKDEIVPVRPTVAISEKVPIDVIRITGNAITIELPETVSAETLEVILRGMRQ
ncbi:MAG: IS66 family insertion sequence element accessory protein TnpB [Ruminococcus sp.]|nr:IS66 family insertion sequence element accessory protein TnpB [Ruminococcus sp.]